MKENNLIYKLMNKKVVQNIIHWLGRLFLRIARWFFDHVTMACWHCGALVGMSSVITRGHMWCLKCYERYVIPTTKEAFVGVDYASKPDQTEKIVIVTKKWGE